MRYRPYLVSLAGILFSVLLASPTLAPAEEPKLFIPDKALCAKMLRFGKQAYERGRYLDAKEYFRMAIQADPASPVAWRYYDQAVIFALAEKVEKDTKLIMPDTSTRQESQPGGPTSLSPPPITPAPAKKDTGFKIVEDEGC
ncbi:MAG: hypothetical protein V1689_10980 [Pseudomonadota bacterium]